MRPAAYNLECVQGDDFEKSFRFRDKATDQPLNLTNWTGAAQVRQDNNARSFVTDLTIIINQLVAPGLVLVTLASETTEVMATAAYLWDLELRDNFGKKRTWLQGTFTILPQVTTPGLA